MIEESKSCNDVMKKHFNKELLMTIKDIKLKLKMSIKILATIKKCLTLFIIQQTQNVMVIQTNWWLVK